MSAMGARRRMDATVLGDSVNQAAAAPRREPVVSLDPTVDVEARHLAAFNQLKADEGAVRLAVCRAIGGWQRCRHRLADTSGREHPARLVMPHINSRRRTPQIEPLGRRQAIAVARLADETPLAVLEAVVQALRLEMEIDALDRAVEEDEQEAR
jgi:hypothetical protein